MVGIELISVLALLQYLWFGAQVGGARARYGIKPPSMSGHDIFERLHRVQVNTLEQLIAFLPALWLASRYWSPTWVSCVGAVYLVGRLIYRSSYIQDPDKRTLGFVLSILPTGILLLATLTGIVMAQF